ncbi:glycoside hydrolase family protein [Lactococcus lactis]|uniref:Lysozyme n=1 Tax=Lactococcus lactis subsp. lactis TaxID=1360 RepID=A0A2N5WAN7_LACLL|nr:glycoside hydrolase family protein [Lactococcus lactis]MBU5242828.1 peptidoglycan DD-metalloendopeptidase family protein [Lactococcus lactis]MDT2856700.1 peptidoglycan DD-metalloendopeptidase family protein [Lactococcus lactis]PLW59307.1 Lysozyme [Lactococcus lactis subsp. lactis]
MKIGTNGLNLIKDLEKCSLTAYRLNDKKITIGWGHAEPVGQTNLVAGVTTWTQAQADNQLFADLVGFENAVSNYFTRSFNQNQFDALVSFAYNLGGGVFANYNWSKTASDSWICSEMILYVNKGTEYEEGLTNRRIREIALYNSSSSNTPGGSGTSSWTWPFTTPYKGKADIPEQQFGTTPLRRGRGYFHDGFDFGSTSYGPDILALSDGEVIYTGVMGDGLGSVIVLSIPPYQVMYQEFSKSMSDILVSVGQKVTKGQRIGRLNGGTHLHLGITQKNWRTALSSWDVDDGSWLNPIDVIQKEMNNSQEEKGEIEMILYKVTDSKSKMNGSIWLFNGEQLTRLDGTSAAKLGQSLKNVDINQAEMSSFKNIGIRTVGDFQY